MLQSLYKNFNGAIIFPEPITTIVTTDVTQINSSPTTLEETKPPFLTRRAAFFKLLKTILPFLFNRETSVARILARSVELAHFNPLEFAVSGPIATSQMLSMMVGTSFLNVIGRKIKSVIRKSTSLSLEERQAKLQEVGEIVLQACVLIIPTHAVILASMYFTGDIWQYAFGYSEECAALINAYFYALMPSVPLISLGTVARQTLVATDRSTFAALNSLLGLGLVGGLGYLFTFGAGPIPAFGITGYAYASSAQALISLIINAIYFGYHKEYRQQYGLFSLAFKKSLPYLRKLWRKGWPIMVQWCGEVFALIARTAIAGKISADALKAIGAAGQLEDFSVGAAFALYSGTQILSSQYRDQELCNLTQTSLLFSLAIAAGVCILFIVPQSQLLLASIFFDTALPANQGTVIAFQQIMTWTGIGQIFDLLRNSANGTLAGCNYNIFPSFSNLLSIAGGVGLSWYLGMFEGWGASGLGLGGAAGLAGAALASLSGVAHAISQPSKCIGYLTGKLSGIFSGRRGAPEEKLPLLATKPISNPN